MLQEGRETDIENQARLLDPLRGPLTLKRGHTRRRHERQPTVATFLPPEQGEIIAGGGGGKIERDFGPIMSYSYQARFSRH